MERLAIPINAANMVEEDDQALDQQQQLLVITAS